MPWPLLAKETPAQELVHHEYLGGAQVPEIKTFVNVSFFLTGCCKALQVKNACYGSNCVKGWSHYCVNRESYHLIFERVWFCSHFRYHQEWGMLKGDGGSCSCGISSGHLSHAHSSQHSPCSCSIIKQMTVVSQTLNTANLDKHSHLNKKRINLHFPFSWLT